MVLEGRGKQPYEPSHLTLFSQGMTDFYKENKELATEGVFDVNLISELGFGRSANQIKEFLKSKGVVGQRKFSRDLREVFHYFTGSFVDPKLTPISAIHKGRNLQIHDILKSIPFLSPLQNNRFIVKLLYDETDKAVKLADASEIVPIYEQYMELRPSKARPLSQQMRELGAVRSMLDVRQQELTEQDRAINFLEHQLSQDNKPKHLREEPYSKQKLFTEEQPPLTDEELEELEHTEELEQTEEQLDLFEQPFKLPKRLDKEEKPQTSKPPKRLKGKGLFIFPREIIDEIPGMGPVDSQGRPVASLDKQMKNLTG